MMSLNRSINQENLKSVSIAGIVLAAGEGKRIGKNKALLEIGGVRSLERVAAWMRKAGCDPVIVVGGAEAESVREEAIRLGVQFALNSNWRSGQFSSLKTGMSALEGLLEPAKQPAGAMVALVDHPLVKKETYQILAGTFRRFPEKIIIPTHQDARGHPVVVPREIIAEILNSSDGTNLRDLIGKHDDLVLEQAVDDTGILKDIDTEMDLKNVNLL